MAPVFHSDIELYYSPVEFVGENQILISGEECNHILNVMRHSIGDELFITDGNGKIYKTKIINTSKNQIATAIIGYESYENVMAKYIFCFPRLKNLERLEFALEKCTEMGVTRFLVFQSERCIGKGEKINRWEKILLSAMKQSLRSFLPKIEYVGDFRSLNSLAGKKLIMDQGSDIIFYDYLTNDANNMRENIYIIIGPEGGLTESEMNSLNESLRFKISNYRLRSETAAINAAAIISGIK